MSESVSGTNKLSDSQRNYVLSLREEGLYKEATLENLKGLLELSSKDLKKEFDNQLEVLDSLKVDRKKSGGEVSLAWADLQKFVNQKKEVLNKNDLILMVYGSMIFDDSNNLDFDLLLLDANDNKSTSDISGILTDELRNIWHGPGHSSVFSLTRLSRFCDHFNSKDSKYIYDWGPDIEMEFDNAAIVMSGELIYPESQGEKSIKTLNNFKKEILSLANTTPELLATMTFNLKRTTVVRDIRRQGLAGFQLRKDS